MSGGQAQLDVAVVGGGPVGSAAAIAHARRGARVLLLEANPKAAARFAGEWIHPPGVSVLERLGVELPPAARAHRSGDGFAVFTDDGGSPIRLPYPGPARGLAWEHGALVGAIRAQAADLAGVTYVPQARATELQGNRLTYATSDGASHEVTAERIIGADGRASFVRQRLLGPREACPISHMAGVELRDVTLPFEGHGHVVLGGPGPILLYRIDGERVRVCLDVPAELRRREALLDAFSSILPEELRDAFRRSLEKRPVLWAANGFRPRVHYGQGPVALVGDAVGHFHPLTAAGITNGLLDVQCLAEHDDVAAYARQRERASYMSELLSNALYQVFARRDDSARAIRHAVYRRWRASEGDRDRTMRLLAGTAPDPLLFGTTFSRMAAEAVRATTGRSIAEREVRSLPSRLAAFAEWAQYPAASLLPAPVREQRRPHSTATDALARASSARTDLGRRHDAEADWAFCESSLGEVSRTFARPIAMLPGDLRTAVTCGYLLCRIADTVEDHPTLPTVERDALYDALLGVLERGDAPEAFARRFRRHVPGDGPDHRLCCELPRVWRTFRALPDDLQQRTTPWVAEMTRGMQIYSHRTAAADGLYALHTVEDLQRYCYFVAGTVGHMLTELFLARMQGADRDRATRLREDAEAFGMGLQLVNILKDVTDDRARGVSFVPRTACAREGLDVRDLVSPGHRDGAHAAVAPLFDLAHRMLDRALRYTLAIPPAEKGIRLFCLLPVWMAARTLLHARGNDAMFESGRPVKIAREEVEALIADCLLVCQDDAAIRERYAALWNPAPHLPVRTESAKPGLHEGHP
ncbi:MAG: FAD-dependent oxidoreductase [Myxococcota bacterium]